MLIKNRTGENQPGKSRPVFIRQPVRYTLALLADAWVRLEKRWEDNPGFVAAAAAGSLGLLLTAALLMNAGLDWLQDTPVEDELAAELPDSAEADIGERGAAESDLGDSSADELLVMRGRKFIAGGRNRDSNAYRAGEDDDSGENSGSFAASGTPTRPAARRNDDDFADDSDDSTETTTPARVTRINAAPQRGNPFDDDEATEELTDRSTAETENASATATEKAVGTVPVQQPDTFEDDDDPAPDEQMPKSTLPEMRVASQLRILQPSETDEEETSAAADQSSGTESNTSAPEPARLKAESPPSIADNELKRAKPVETDDRLADDRPEPDRSINLVRGPADKVVPRDDNRWKQQRTKSVAESDAPAVAARQSRPVETKIFAAPKTRSAPVAKESRTSPDNSTVSPLRLAISAPPTVGVGQPCQIEIQVTNTGSVPAQHLVVSAELPQGLVHDVAQSLEQQIKTLAPGATYRALLRLRGEAVGEQTIQAEVESAERAALKLSAKVRVTRAAETATTIGEADCFCAPLVR